MTGRGCPVDGCSNPARGLSGSMDVTTRTGDGTTGGPGIGGDTEGSGLERALIKRGG